jgi:hypothetical protein
MGPTALLPLRRKSCYGFLSPLKIHRPRPGLNPRTVSPVVSTLPLDHLGRLHAFLTSVSDGVAWLNSPPPGRFTSGERIPGIHCVRGWMDPRRGLDVMRRHRNSIAARKLTLVAQSVTSHNTEQTGLPDRRTDTMKVIGVFILLFRNAP